MFSILISTKQNGHLKYADICRRSRAVYRPIRLESIYEPQNTHSKLRVEATCVVTTLTCSSWCCNHVAVRWWDPGMPHRGTEQYLSSLQRVQLPPSPNFPSVILQSKYPLHTNHSTSNASYWQCRQTTKHVASWSSCSLLLSLSSCQPSSCPLGKCLFHIITTEVTLDTPFPLLIFCQRYQQYGNHAMMWPVWGNIQKFVKIQKAKLHVNSTIMWGRSWRRWLNYTVAPNATKAARHAQGLSCMISMC
jgi:hypothetical protein